LVFLRKENSTPKGNKPFFLLKERKGKEKKRKENG